MPEEKILMPQHGPSLALPFRFTREISDGCGGRSGSGDDAVCSVMSVASPAVSGARTCSNNSLSDEEILESSEGGETQMR